MHQLTFFLHGRDNVGKKKLQKRQMLYLHRIIILMAVLV